MANITVDIQAKVVGYEQSIKALQAALAKVDPGSDMGKSITKAMEQAQSQVKALSKNMFPKASSDSQIDAIIEKTNRVGEAIQRVASLLQNVQISDLNLGAFGGDIETFKNQIASLQTELDSKLSAGIIKAVGESEQLKNVFQSLGTDLSKATGATLLDDLSKGAQKAANDVTELEKKLEKTQTSISNYQTIDSALKSSKLGTLEGRVALDDELKAITGNYEAVIEQLRTTITNGLTSLKTDAKLDTEGFIKTFFSDLTPENVQAHIQNLFNTLSSQGVFSENERRKFYEAIFGNNDQYSTTNINTLTKSIGLDKAYEQYKIQFKEFYQKIVNDIDGKDQAKISRFISDNELDKAVNATTAALDSAYSKIYNNIKSNQKKLNEALSDKDNIALQLGAARQVQSNLGSAEQELRTAIERVSEENKTLRTEINQLREQLNQRLGTEVNGIRSTGTTQNSNINQGLRESLEISEAYKNQLAQVAAKEQALGKLQGVVQRWFSIYAAIRMVRQAIDSVISTVKELDATITEIAIVTSMDQSELWDQMPKYTQLARDYAASISGVYQVSQLYYQQGLQTADVMALTEQTLKMARISGLDYAQATDYMTNAVRSFKMEMTDAQRVVDVYSAIAASSATSVTELASAMSKTASSAQAVGSSFENTTAMMAVMIEATRESAENIGSAMKSIISRYGEMTSDPSKLVDSEGQEMSLNRVDKALQTVGISIHNAAGEFRNFDEVIMELAQKWDTIDTNTQRYIATIMAGNRQQSRFLALVSSYDRLKELSAEAADSEDASQLQFLKTLDSVEAKTQQLQTSIQALYVNSGLEDFYKRILDVGNRIMTTFDQLSEKNGLISVVGKVSGAFTTLATLVTTVFTTIKAHYSMNRQAMLAEEEYAIAQGIADEQAKATELGMIYDATTGAYIKAEEDRVAAAQKAADERLEIARQENNKQQSLKKITTPQQKMARGGMLASTIGLAATTYAASLDINQNRGLKAGMTGAGGALSGLGTTLMMWSTMGPGIAIAAGALSALPSIIEAIGMSTETTSEKLERLSKNIENANNTKLEAKSNLQTLESYKEKYDELNEKQYQSEEAKQEFIKIQNEIAASYPELIKGMTQEGNYVVDMTTAYEQLAAAKRKAYSEAFSADLGAEIQGLSDIHYVMKNIYGVNPFKDGGILSTNTYGKYDQFIYDQIQGNTDKKISSHWGDSLNTNDYFQTFFNGRENFQKLMEERGTSRGYTGYSSKAFEPINTSTKQTVNQVWDLFLESAQKGLSFAEAQNNLNTSLANGQITFNENPNVYKVGTSKDDYINLASSAIEGFDQEIYSHMITIAKATEFQKDLIHNKIKSSNEEYVNILKNSAASVMDTESNELQNYAASLDLTEGLENYIKENENRIGALEWDATEGKSIRINEDKLISEYYADKNEQWYNAFIEAHQKDLDDTANNIYKNLGSYSTSEIEQQDISDNARALLLKALNEEYGKISERYSNWIQNLDINDSNIKAALDSYQNDFGPAFLQSIQNQYKKILDNTALDNDTKTIQLSNLTSIYDVIQDIQNQDFSAGTTLLQAMQSADLTSLTGINNLIDSIQSLDIDFDTSGLIGLIQSFASNLVVIFETEFQTYTEEIINKSKEFEKTFSKLTKGISFDEMLATVNELGVSIENFDNINGKYYLKDLSILRDKYELSDQAFEQNINNRITAYGKLSDVVYEEINEGISVNFDEYLNSLVPQDLREKLLNATNYEEYNKVLEEIQEYADSSEESAVNYADIIDLIQVDELKSESQANLNDLIDNAKSFAELETYLNEHVQDSWFTEQGLSRTQVYNEIRGFMNSESYGKMTFLDYVKNVLPEQWNAIQQATNDYYEDTFAKNLLAAGDIEGFIETAAKKSITNTVKSEDAFKNATVEEINDEVIRRYEELLQNNPQLQSQITSGDINNLPAELQKYTTLIYDTFHSARESVVNSLISSVGGNGTNLIKVTDTNKKILEDLQAEGKGWVTGNIVSGNYVTIAAEKLTASASEFQNYIAQSFETTSEKIKALSQYHQNQYSNTQVTSLDKVLTTEAFSYEDMLQYLVSNYQFNLDTSMENLPAKMEELGLAFNSVGEVIVSDYKAWITSLEFGVNQLRASGKASQADLNKAQKKLDDAKNAQEQAIVSGFDGILKDYSNISTESVENLANALNMSYEQLVGYINEAGEYVEGYLTSNGNGTYQLDISKISALLSKLNGKVSQATIETIEKSISSIGDTYLSNIKNVTSYSTKGASSLADIEAFRQSYADIVGETLSEDAFSYDKILQTFTLDPAYMQKYINAQKEKLRQLGYTEEFIEQYVQDQTTKVVQDAISIEGLLNARTGEERQQEVEKLGRAIQDYLDLGNKISGLELQSYQDQVKVLEESSTMANKLDVADELHALYSKYNRMSSALIINTLYAGGEDAIAVLKQLKPEASADEISSVYSAAINRLNTALSDVENIMVGSLVDTGSKLYQILKRVNPEGVNADGVIQSAYNMVDVYAAIYAEMTKTAGATTAGLNDAYAKLLTAQDQTNIDITEALKNGNGMSYADFGNLLAKYDIKFEDYMTEHWDTVMRDGFGNIRITDWEGFAKNVFKTDNLDAIRNTDEYISAFKAYNDGLIELNKNTEQAITDEIKQIENAKAGDWLNFSELWTKLQNVTSKAIENVYINGYNGNVELGNRKIVSPEIMNQAFPWAEFTSQDYATIFGQTFTAQDLLENSVFQQTKENIGLVFAQIDEAGQAVTDVAEYATSLLGSTLDSEGHIDIDTLLEYDQKARNLILDVRQYASTMTNDQVWETEDALAQVIHEREEQASNMRHWQTQLETYGASLEDGILKLGDNANLIGIADTLSQMAEGAGLEIGNGLEEVQDAVLNVLSSIREIISQGIEGGLTGEEVETLRTRAQELGISNINFTETKEGFKLTTESAKELYFALNDLNGFQGEALFEDLSESLIETDSHFKTVQDTLTYINELSAEIQALRNEEDPVKNQDRIASLENELALAEKINMTRSIDSEDDSFNFMDNDIPAAQNNPLNYWQNWADAFEAMKEAGSATGSAKNTIGYEDFYNIVTEIGRLADLSGQSVTLGDTILKNSQDAANLITEAAGALKNVDGEMKIDLSKINIDFSSGLQDLGNQVDEQVDALATEQIAMLDSIIAVLEIIVAMEALEDVDVNKDMHLDFSELGITVDGADNITAVNDNLAGVVAQLSSLDATLEDGTSILDAVSIDTGKAQVSFREFLTNWNNLTWLSENGITGTTFSQLFNNLYTMAKSDAYNDKEMTVQSIVDLFQSLDWGDLAVSVNSGNHTLTLNDSGMYSLNWETMNYDNYRNIFEQEIPEKKRSTDEEIKARVKAAYESEVNSSEGLSVETNTEIKVLQNKVVKIEEGDHKGEYKAGNQYYDSLEQAVAASDLFEVGAKNIKVQGEGQTATAEGEVVIGNYHMKVTSQQAGAKFEADDGTEFDSKQAAFDYMFNRDMETSGEVNHESAEYQEWEVEQGIRLTPVYKITDEDGNSYSSDLNKNPEMRTALKNFINNIDNEKVTLSEDGQSITVEFAPGMEITMPAEGIQFGDDFSEEALKSALTEQLGIDEALKDTISSAITEAFTNLSSLLTTLDSSKVSELGTAFKTVYENVQAVATGLQQLAENLSKLTGVDIKIEFNLPDLPTGGENGVGGEEPEIEIPVGGKATGTTPEAVEEELANAKEKAEEKAPEVNNAVSEKISEIDKIKKATATMANAIPDEFTNVLQIASPSQVMIEKAKFVGEGIEQGLNESQSIVEAAAEALGQVIIDKIEETATKVSESIDKIVEAINKVKETQLDIDTNKILNHIQQVQTALDQLSETKPKIEVDTANAEAQLEALKNKLKVIETTQKITPEGFKEDIDDFDTTQTINTVGGVYDIGDFTTYQTIITRGGGGSGCFVAGTKIYMADGTIKNIEDIYLNDVVIAYNPETNEFVPKKVIDGYTHHNTPRIVEVAFSDGTSLKMTPSHPILTTKGWRSLDPIISLDEHGILPTWLEIGDKVNGYYGEVEVINISELSVPKNYDTYDFEVEDCHTFLAEGIPVHNAMITGPAMKNAAGTDGGGGKAKGSPTWLNPQGHSFAKGNITGAALAGGRTRTLMGELGPELYVAGGRYYMAGQNGAEFVNLPDDAIVFNHMQTKSLMSKGQTGHGKPVTSERNAISWAKGNINGGPAMASASAALAALKQLRAMWESLKSASISDLAGAGGGGGGGGSSGNSDEAVDPKEWVGLVERWYNLTQKIAQAEKEITHEEQLRAKIQSDFTKNGQHYFRSQMTSLKALKEQIAAQEQLNLSRENYYNKRRDALKDSALGKLIEFDEKGQMFFRKDLDPSKFDGFTDAMEWRTWLTGYDEDHKARFSSKQKYDKLKAVGLVPDHVYDSNGKEITMDSDSDGEITDQEKEDYYYNISKQVFDNMDEYQEAQQSLYDSIEEGKTDLLELEEQRNKIMEEMRENQQDVEESVLEAIEDMKQREIDALQDERDKLEESVGKYIDGLNDALDREREMYDTQESQNELDTQKRRLAILQRSGGSAADISSLQSEIQANERDLYFDAQEAQINAIQEASDLEIERLDTQIGIMQETLDYQKEYGLLWYNVYDVMNRSSGEITNFIMNGNSNFWKLSPLGTATQANETLFKAEQWDAYKTEMSNAASDLSEMVELRRKEVKENDYKLFNEAMQKEFGKDYDKSGYYKELFDDYYTEGEHSGDVTAITSAITQEYSALDTRKKKAGDYWTHTGPDRYISIDDKQHWHYKYKEETIEGVKNWYFTSKKKEDHEWNNKNKCSKCGHTKPAPAPATPAPSDWSPDNCADKCSGICKGQLWNDTSKSGGCFTAGTQIYMADGSLKNIEDVKIGEMVLAYDEQNKIFIPRRVYDTILYIGTEIILNIELINGIKLEITPGHPILTLNGWKSRDRDMALYEHEILTEWLYEDDIIVGYLQNFEIKSIITQNILRGTPVYNLTIEDCHTFIANGAVVHNASSEPSTGGGRGDPIMRRVSRKAAGGYVRHGIYELGEQGTETVLTAQQTQVLRNNILSNRPSSLISLLKSYNEGFSRMDTPLTGTTTEDNSTNIDKLEFSMNVQQISNDYDARRAGEQAMNEIMRIARKTSAANSIRR